MSMRSMLLAPILLLTLVSPSLGNFVGSPDDSVEPLGVCDARPDGVECWDMNGTRSAALADTLRSHFAREQEVQFRIGKKNRHLMVRRPSQTRFSYQLMGGNTLNTSNTNNGELVYDFIRIAVEASDIQANLTAARTLPSPNSIDVPFREGATAEIEGRKLEIGPATRVEPQKRNNVGDPFLRPAAGDLWAVVMGVSGGEPGSASCTYTPIDAAGKPILFVDAAGKPITALKALSLEPKLQPGTGYSYNNPEPVLKPKAANAVFAGYGNAPAFRVTTNIDPKAIASLKILGYHTDTKTLGPFPLDPR